MTDGGAAGHIEPACRVPAATDGAVVDATGLEVAVARAAAAARNALTTS